MKKYKLSIILLLLFTPFLTMGQESLSYKLVRGAEDSVTSKRHYIVGSAERGSTIYIDGKKIKQYATGSFGTQLELKEGHNSVVISVTNRGTRVNDTLSIFYKPPTLTSKEKSASSDRGSSLLPVIITDSGAFFNSSTAGDRLGGNKINFISEGVKMELLEIEGEFYKVKLSQNRAAYLQKRFAQQLPLGATPAQSVVNSCSAIANRGEDRVKIFLNERVPYIIHTQNLPNRIIVELHNAYNNSNWVTQYNNLKAISSLDIYQSATDVVTLQLDLKESYSWGYRVEYEGNNLIVSVKHTPKALYSRSKRPLEGITIGLDAGHGGSATGAISPSGMLEKELNLDMVNRLKRILEKRGAKVVLSRSDDTDLSIAQRVEIFREGNIDLLLSIHNNSGGNPLNPMGSSTYYKHIEYRPFASAVLNKLLELGVVQYGMVGNFNFGLCSPTDFPSILVETLFMSSLPDEEKLFDPTFRAKLMEKVAQGVEEYIGKVRSSLVE
ncbi:MAG: N-acetylmuramoyl-L-alanine amidase [Bacteroidales bacterium]